MQQSDRTHVPTWLNLSWHAVSAKIRPAQLRLNSPQPCMATAYPLLSRAQSCSVLLKFYSVLLSSNQSCSVLISLAQFYSTSDPPCIADIFHHGYPTSLLSCPVLAEMMFSLYRD